MRGGGVPSLNILLEEFSIVILEPTSGAAVPLGRHIRTNKWRSGAARLVY